MKLPLPIFVLMGGCASIQGSWRYEGAGDPKIHPDCVASSMLAGESRFEHDVLLKFEPGGPDWVIETTYRDADEDSFEFVARLERKTGDSDVMIVKNIDRIKFCREDLLACPSQNFLNASIAEKMLTRNQDVANRFYASVANACGAEADAFQENFEGREAPVLK